MSIKVDEMSTRVERIEEDVRDLFMVKDEAVESQKVGRQFGGLVHVER